MLYKAKNESRRRAIGFTLVQLVLVLGILSMLATLLFSAFSGGRATADRAQCDSQLKTIALALDAHRQEFGIYPTTLQTLIEKHYLHDTAALHCPADIRPDGTYGDFYVIRSPRDGADLPTVVCPFHEASGNGGTQAFKGIYTKQFLTRPAVLVQANNASVERPGQTPISASAGMVLRGGDRIRTVAGGAAQIRFADNSTCDLSGNSDVTVLQSFVASSTGNTLYTMVRQTLGTVMHRVNHGSKYDVATPTATAGALGTAFQITINPDGSGTLNVIESQVYVSSQRAHAIIPTGRSTTFDSIGKTPLSGLDPNPTPTPTTPPPPTLAPTATPRPTSTPRPTPTPTCRPHNSGHGNANGHCD